MPTVRRTPRSGATGAACKCELPALFSDNRQSTTRHGRLEPIGDWLSARRSGEMPGAGVACLLCCTVLFVVDPARHRVTPRCPIRTVTGFDCPGCGGLRAVHELLHLRPAVALHSNPLLVLAVPVGGWLAAAHALRTLGGPVIPSWKPSERTILGVLVAFGLLRNASRFERRTRSRGSAHPQNSSSSPSELMSSRLTE